MSLLEEVEKAQKEIVKDGYDMSFGELISLYKEEELIINPDFQRMFRWDSSRKTRFIESLLLGIPIPPIFVFQNDDGVWELIDGLQRLSTVFEFAGLLRVSIDGENKLKESSVLQGTKFLPSLNGKNWESKDENGIGKILQLEIKRARIRVEILKKESDEFAKYELFQRLNTGGAHLSEQEVRNCTAIMINKDFHDLLVKCSENESFTNTVKLSENAKDKRELMEHALRFFAFKYIEYEKGLGVNEYLDDALMKLASKEKLDVEKEFENFVDVFRIIFNSLGDGAFKKWDGSVFKGKFLVSAYEAIISGVLANLDALNAMDAPSMNAFIKDKVLKMWGDKFYLGKSGAGTSGASRLRHLPEWSRNHFKNE